MLKSEPCLGLFLLSSTMCIFTVDEPYVLSSADSLLHVRF
uniref:Uncharacterized protein n=1 Tax=Lotus japonicus TaxID=34305 RepID=I3SUJ5_LOTJA|nr:unknown [Lotus japonicus]